MYIKIAIFLALTLMSLTTFSDEGYSPDVEIEVLCHCVNDCDRKEKCNWLWLQYKSLVSKSSDVDLDDLSIIRDQKLSLIEIVDAGNYGCYTTFGLFDKKYYRTDVEFLLPDNVEISNFLIKEVSSVPSLDSRKNSDSDDLCLFLF